MSEKRFPILPGGFRGQMSNTVPWEWAEEAYKEYVQQFGTTQSLERIAERGGFASGEMIWLLYSAIVRHRTKGTENERTMF